MPTERPSEPAPRSKWNYHPELPLADKSIFGWPLDLRFLARWFRRSWLSLSERILLLLVAVAAWYFLYPGLEQARTFAVGWILQTWVVNMGLMLAVAGSLHWYFYIRRGQGKKLKFDHRDMAKGSRTFTFRNQVHDNMFWSLGSGVLFWTAFQVLTLWAMANGYLPTTSFADNPVWFLAFFVLMPIWSALHFYWIHRLLHVPFFYRHFHCLHHRNVNVGPWSGASMHPVEHLLYFSSVIIHLVAASHPVHVIYNLHYQALGAAMSHTGYEDLLIKDKRRLELGTFYHQLHHRFFECNYGNQEMPWDRWFGTFHDGSDEATRMIRERKQRMHGAG